MFVIVVQQECSIDTEGLFCLFHSFDEMSLHEICFVTAPQQVDVERRRMNERQKVLHDQVRILFRTRGPKPNLDMRPQSDEEGQELADVRPDVGVKAVVQHGMFGVGTQSSRCVHDCVVQIDKDGDR